jgi:predicted DCC family thiol-disulfide oxidoreductase YuxK
LNELPTDFSNPIIFYDGVCGLCNRLVRFVLKHDQRDWFRFAALQSDFARNILRQHNCDRDDLDRFYLVLDYQQSSERLLSRNDAAVEVLRQLGGRWRALAALLALSPKQLRDWRYNLIARNRYRMFGKHQTCPLPNPKDRHKFLDATAPADKSGSSQ